MNLRSLYAAVFVVAFDALALQFDTVVVYVLQVVVHVVYGALPVHLVENYENPMQNNPFDDPPLVEQP